MFAWILLVVTESICVTVGTNSSIRVVTTKGGARVSPYGESNVSVDFACYNVANNVRRCWNKFFVLPCCYVVTRRSCWNIVFLISFGCFIRLNVGCIPPIIVFQEEEEQEFVPGKNASGGAVVTRSGRLEGV